MKTKFNRFIIDWTNVKNHCRTTENKLFTEKVPTEEFKQKLLVSEHSPIRLLSIDWSWEDIPSWVATHWSRHKWECFISTQRDDRKEHTISRNDMPQGTLVKFDGYANMQSLIDTFRKRLCFQASPETRHLAEDFKVALHEIWPELADILVPNCIYRCGCPEFKMCDQELYQLFLEKAAIDYYEKLGSYANLSDIRVRYGVYNEWFYSTHPYKET